MSEKQKGQERIMEVKDIFSLDPTLNYTSITFYNKCLFQIKETGAKKQPSI